jgi:predicted Zn-dependent protease
LALEPDNEHMLSLVGRAMSTTHDYQGTNDYYERVLTENPQNLDMKIDYANLLVKNNHLDVS